VKEWVEKRAKPTRPDRIHWVHGSEEEMRQLVDIGIRQEETGAHYALHHDVIGLPPDSS